jgi:hypothetical protein
MLNSQLTSVASASPRPVRQIFMSSSATGLSKPVLKVGGGVDYVALGYAGAYVTSLCILHLRITFGLLYV